ncbi:HpcH/HpaI aldolase family protein [Palleronia sp. KMU-117]|uniref:HpcH/HpaI aldolase family protein n=1 Tax=Palleronia sp. KMU-117 TaxID=3434108 RepID=UPI003D7428DC
MATFKQKLAGEARLTAHICTIPSPAVTQAMAAGGADAVIIDMEHGAIDHAQAHAMIAAVLGASCAPLVRVPSIDETAVKRVLDLGAEGICFPMVRTADDARRAVASLRYPPEGTRGFGPFLAHLGFGTTLLGYPAEAARRMVCMLLIETAEAVDNIDAILAVEGIDIIIPAQFDLSTSLGLQGQFDHPDFIAALEKVERAADRAGIPRGAVALSEAQARAAFGRGNRLIAGFDILWLRGIAADAQGWCG